MGCATAPSPFGGAASASPFGGACASSASPFGGGVGASNAVSPFASGGAAGGPCAWGVSSYSSRLPPLVPKAHEEVDLELVIRSAFEGLRFQPQMIPEVEPPPSVC